MLWTTLFLGRSVSAATSGRVQFWSDPGCTGTMSHEWYETNINSCDQWHEMLIEECDDDDGLDCEDLPDFPFCRDFDEDDEWMETHGSNVEYTCEEESDPPTPAPLEPTCTDNDMNGDETGVDCGGSCPSLCPATCDTLDCGTSHYLKDNPQTIDCLAAECSFEVDVATCCIAKALCTTLDCRTSVLIEAADSTYCEEDTCQYTDDRGTCCTDPATCANFTLCNDETQYLKDQAELFECGAVVCDETDISRCCSNKMPCSSYSCESTHVRVENSSSIYCTSNDCEDDPLASIKCCTARASCSNFTCDEFRYLDKPTKDSAYCASSTCDSPDWAYCCDQKYPCKFTLNNFQYTCSEFTNNTLSPNAENLYCGGITCESPRDDAYCCIPEVTPCDENACDIDSQNVNTSQMCLGNPCNQIDDVHCCINRESCDGFSLCTLDTTYIIADAYCNGADCDSDDVVNCCGTRQECANMYPACDSETEITNDVTCANDTCTPSECCTARADCIPNICNAGQYVTGGYCAGSTCDSSDNTNCCGAQESCSTYENCTVTQIVNVDEYCESGTCKSSDSAICCTPREQCTNYICDTMTSFLKSENYCAGSTCDSSDSATCCGTRQSCQAYGDCNSATEIISSSGYCANDTCYLTDADDCCIPREACYEALCDATQFTDSNLYCSGSTCDSNDVGVCCEDRASCGEDYGDCDRCQELVEDSYCSTDICTPLDNQTCCRNIVGDTSSGAMLRWNVLFLGVQSEDDSHICSSWSEVIATRFGIPCEGMTCTKSLASDVSRASDDKWNVTFEIYHASSSMVDSLRNNSVLEGLASAIADGVSLETQAVVYSGQNTSSDSGSGLSVGIIVVIVLAVVIIIAVIGLAVCQLTPKEKQPMGRLVEM